MSVIIITPDATGPVRKDGIGTACFHYARTLANAGIPTTILYTGSVQGKNAEKWKTWYKKFSIEFLAIDDLLARSSKNYPDQRFSELSFRVFEYLRVNYFRYILFQDWQANGFWTSRAKQLGISFHETTLGIIAHSPNEWQKSVMETFGDNPLNDAAQEWGERQAIANVDIIVSPSHHMIEWLKKSRYQLPNRVEICPYTFEDETHPNNANHADRDHLIFFGNLETRKGLHLFVETLRALKFEGIKLPRKVSFLGNHASVLGESSDKYLKKLLRDIPEIEYVVKTTFDYTRAIEYIRKQNGVVVIASLLDNYPLTVIESIANGFSFIASTAGGILEMVDEAILFEPTIRSLKAKLLMLPDISFGNLVHKYSPEMARTKWLAHVADVCGSPVSQPAIKQIVSDAVSVCIPFYYFDKFLPRLITGFLQDAHPGLQLVFVNDGTPEADCPNFYRLKAKLEPIGHIFYIQNNAGAGAARNKAAELARHHNLIFFDADNMPLRGMATKLVKALHASGADSIAAPYAAVPAFTRHPLACDTLYKYIPNGGPLASAMLDNHLGDTCGIQRRDVFEALGGFNTNRNYYDDWEYFIKLVGNGYRHSVYPEVLFYYAFDPTGRRARDTEYQKRTTLLTGLDAVEPTHLREVLKVFIKDAYVTRQNRRIQ